MEASETPTIQCASTAQPVLGSSTGWYQPIARVPVSRRGPGGVRGRSGSGRAEVPSHHHRWHGVRVAVAESFLLDGPVRRRARRVGASPDPPFASGGGTADGMRRCRKAPPHRTCPSPPPRQTQFTTTRTTSATRARFACTNQPGPCDRARPSGRVTPWCSGFVFFSLSHLEGNPPENSPMVMWGQPYVPPYRVAEATPSSAVWVEPVRDMGRHEQRPEERPDERESRRRRESRERRRSRSRPGGG